MWQMLRVPLKWVRCNPRWAALVCHILESFGWMGGLRPQTCAYVASATLSSPKLYVVILISSAATTMNVARPGIVARVTFVAGV